MRAQIQAASKPLTFWKWLCRQRRRDDPVGDFARDAWEERPHGRHLGRIKARKPRTEGGWIRYLEQIGACPGAIEAARRAWAEFNQADGRAAQSSGYAGDAGDASS